MYVREMDKREKNVKPTDFFRVSLIMYYRVCKRIRCYMKYMI